MDQADQALVDTTPYGYGKNDSVTDATENAAVTQHTITVDGKPIPYTARCGHLVTTGLYGAQPVARMFYVSFTANVDNLTSRPVTFFYNGGPGSSCAFLLLGSFGPRRIRTSMPNYTPPAPYEMVDNAETVLDQSDLVFIDPVGTAYSSAIAPHKNGDFWNTDEDARSIAQFVKRYLTVFNRWNSPKFIFGESYGTPRTCVVAWLLHEDGVDLNGVMLQSSILDFSQNSNSVGLLPTLAADALFYQKVSLTPPPADLPGFLKDVEKFARNDYSSVIRGLMPATPEFLNILSALLGIRPELLLFWRLDLATNRYAFLKALLQDKGEAIGVYDGRVKAVDTGIAGSIPLASGANDPAMAAVGGVVTAMWNTYLNDELKFTATAPFISLNDQVYANFNFAHTDPTGLKQSAQALCTTGDLAAAMTVNPYLKVFSANGYYDAVTPYLQTILNFENMPLDPEHRSKHLTVKNFASGHMIYLNPECRVEMRKDLNKFYEKAHEDLVALVEKPEELVPITTLRYSRLMRRSPY
jgi:carboxypeptidase C (cathepsin A)